MFIVRNSLKLLHRAFSKLQNTFVINKAEREAYFGDVNSSRNDSLLRQIALATRWPCGCRPHCLVTAKIICNVVICIELYSLLLEIDYVIIIYC